MRTLLSAPRWVLFACLGLIVIVWLDVLDLVESVSLLAQPGYAEANVVLSLADRATFAVIKVLIPILVGAILLVTYRRSPVLFRTLTLILWLAAVPYAIVVVHNLQLLWTR